MATEIKLYCGCNEKNTTAIWHFNGPTEEGHLVHMLCHNSIADPPLQKYWRPVPFLSCACGEAFEVMDHKERCPVRIVWAVECVRERLDKAATPTTKDSGIIPIVFGKHVIDVRPFREAAHQVQLEMERLLLEQYREIFIPDKTRW